MQQLTKDEACALYNGGEWRDWTDGEVVKVQLYQDRLCVPFDRFHQAAESVLGRRVYTHEFGRPELLQAEYEGKRAKPTFDDIMALLPRKPIIVGGRS